VFAAEAEEMEKFEDLIFSMVHSRLTIYFVLFVAKHFYQYNLSNSK